MGPLLLTFRLGGCVRVLMGGGVYIWVTVSPSRRRGRRSRCVDSEGKGGKVVGVVALVWVGLSGCRKAFVSVECYVVVLFTWRGCRGGVGNGSSWEAI